MGIRGRLKIIKEFDEKIVIREYLNLINRVSKNNALLNKSMV